MISSSPPPYSEAASAPPEIPNFCSKCGHKCKSDASLTCDSCGKVRVFTQQPMPFVDFPPQSDRKSAPVEVVSTTQPGSSSTQQQDSNQNSSFNLEMYVIKDGRLIIDFEKVSCCPCQTVGIDERATYNAPTPLKNKGITDSQWKSWIKNLMKVQKKAPSIIGCLCIFCFPGLIVQSMLCAMLCPTSMAWPLDFLPFYYGDWYRGLKGWMEDVNKILNPLEMHAKLLTYKPYNNAPRSKLYGQRIAGKDEKYEMSFLAIALNKQASEKLIIECWDHGVNDGCTSGIGRLL